MSYIIRDWGFDDFPRNLDVPNYLHSEPIGPDFSFRFFNMLFSPEVRIEQIDFDNGKISFLSDVSSVDESGDRLYVEYVDPKFWVYVYSTDLSWAGLLTNGSPQDLLPVADLTAARVSYANSYLSRTTVEAAYYDVDKLKEWNSALGFE